MADFVAEVRPRSLQPRNHTSPQVGKDLQVEKGFVAEIKSRSYNPTDMICQSLDLSDSYLETVLSGKHFSKEKLVHLLERSIISLIEKLMMGQSVSKIEGSLCISVNGDETPVVVELQQTFPTFQKPKPSTVFSSLKDQVFDGCLNVKIKDRDLLSTCHAEEKFVGALSPMYECNRDSCHGVTESRNGPEVTQSFHSSKETSSPCPTQHKILLRTSHDVEHLSPTPEAEVHVQVQNSKSSSENRTDSDGESGYLSNEKEEILANVKSDSSDAAVIAATDAAVLASSPTSKSVNSFSDYYCSGFDGPNTCHTPETISISPSRSDVESCISPSRSDVESCISPSRSDVESCISPSRSDVESCISPSRSDVESCISPSRSDVESCISPSRSDVESCRSSGEGSDCMDYEDDDDDDTEFEQRLVIDENPVSDQKTSEIDDFDNGETKEAKEESQTHSEKDLHKDCSSKVDALSSLPSTERENLTSDTDPDCQENPNMNEAHTVMELSESSKSVPPSVPVSPHPQSHVTKCPEGFLCRLCSRVLADVVSVSKHIASDHDLHCCTYCCKTFTAKNNLKRHVRLHAGSRPYKCSHCLQSFSRRDDLKGHILRHNHSKPFRCSLCKKGYTDRACVKNHMAKEHKSRLTHVCPQCGESFDREDVYASHKLTHPELHQFSCGKCSFIGTNNLMTLKHSLIHSHKLFSCRACNAYFADPFDYTSHLKKHKNSSLSQFVCCFCDAALATYDQFIKHEYSHAQGKTHACKTCRKQFRSKSNLQEHLLNHESPKLDKQDICEGTRLGRTVWSVGKDMQKNCVCGVAKLLPGEEVSVRLPSDVDAQESFSPTSQEDAADDFEGQLLDLSMKKPSSPTFNKNDCSGIQNENRHSWVRVEGPAAAGHVPGNGRFSESSNRGQGHEFTEREMQARRSLEAENLQAKLYRKMSQQREVELNSEMNPLLQHHGLYNIAENSLEAVSDRIKSFYFQTGTTFPIILRGTEKMKPRLLDSIFQLNNQHRDVDKNSSSRPLRFSPISRDKFADLAAKFMVARGSKLSRHGASLKRVSPLGKKKREAGLDDEYFGEQKQTAQAVLSNWQSTDAGKRKYIRGPCDEGRRDLPSLTLKDNGETACETSDPETALRRHIPTVVVKSEPLMEQDRESPLDCRFQKVRDGNNNLSAGNGSNLPAHAHKFCDICKEEFGSFADLENHSVEIHRRYLCEHCGKSFTARPNRDRHVRYHTGERPYKCDLCDMAFFRGDDLKYHRTTRHPTAQPYVCTRCSASFTWGRDLERHIRHSKCTL